MRSQSHDVVVVGGGIIGLACAYSLAKEGLQAVLLERGLPGAEQTVRTGGGIRLCHSSAVNVRLSKLSLPTWEQFQENFGFDPEFRQIGHLCLARSHASAEAFEDQAHLHDQLDVTAAGFSGTGLMHAPVVGSLVAELASTGEAESMDISELASSRFKDEGVQRDSSGF